jgi:DNA-binding NtrC family response regulator
MPHRRKILIVENDDFLREILGNLLHKEGNYIISGFRVEKTLEEARRKNISLVILGTSCERYDGKKSIHYIQKNLGHNIQFFIINNSEKEIDFVSKDMQMKVSDLSVSKIIEKIQSLPYTYNKNNENKKS